MKLVWLIMYFRLSNAIRWTRWTCLFGDTLGAIFNYRACLLLPHLPCLFALPV